MKEILRHFDIALWARLITVRMVRQGIVDAEDSDVYEYGFDVLIYTVISLGSVLLLGALLGIFKETALYLLVPIPLQGLGGGFHASTHARCFTTLVSAYLIGMALCFLLPPFAALALGALGFLAIFRLAPIEHVNAPMTDEKAVRMRRFARVYSALLFTLSALLIWRYGALGVPFAIGLFTSGVSMGAATWLKRRDI